MWTHSRENCSCEKRVQTMLSWSTGKKSSSPSVSGSATSPPIQQPHSGCHSETKVRKSHGGFVVHVNGRRSPVWASIPLVLAALPCLSATSLWTCGVWNTFQADMGYCNRSSMVSPVEMNVWACACVCEMTSQPSRAEVLQHNSCHRGLESGPAPLQESLSVTPPLFCCPRCLFFPVKGQPRHVTDNPPTACSEVSVCITSGSQTTTQRCRESFSIKTQQLWPGFLLGLCIPNVVTKMAGSLKWQLCYKPQNINSIHSLLACF